MSLEILPDEALREYLLNFGYEVLTKLIHLKTDAFRRIIDEAFWCRKFTRDFGRPSYDPKIILSWRELYEVKVEGISNYLQYTIEG